MPDTMKDTDRRPKQTPELLAKFADYLPAAQLTDPNHLGPLALLAGTWHGSHGLNTITLPSTPDRANMGPQERDQINLYEETMVFEVIPGLTPNRGTERDQWVSQIKYHTDVTEQGTGAGLHFENGLFLNRGCLDSDPETVRLARQCSVPHGNSVICRGVVATEFESIPDYATTSAKSSVRGFVVPIPGVADIGNLQTLLTDALTAEGVTIDGGVHLHFDTDWAAEIKLDQPNITDEEAAEVHGIGSIPFVSDQATTTQMTADFYILRVTDASGNKSVRLQYLQTVMLHFFGIDWPHVGLNSLQLMDTQSPELSDAAPTFTEWVVENGFEALLGRVPKAAELQRWSKAMDDAQGQQWPEFVTWLMARPRFAIMARRQGVEDRVERFYQFLLGRQSDPGGKELTVREINAGNTAKRLSDMMVSQEAKDFYHSLFAED
jgi:hypothetical protein